MSQQTQSQEVPVVKARRKNSFSGMIKRFKMDNPMTGEINLL